MRCATLTLILEEKLFMGSKYGVLLRPKNGWEFLQEPSLSQASSEI